jgi:hypothetical protein
MAKDAKLPQGYQSEISDIRSGGIFDIGVGWTLPEETDEAIEAFVTRTGTFYHPGEWNQIRVKCQGDRIQTWVNGQLCSDLVDDKYKKGMIGLQHNAAEGGVVRFRNPRIREIDDSE